MRESKTPKKSAFGAATTEPRLREKEGQSAVKTGKGTASSPRTEGLTRLDQNRAASLADEGGASAATVEKERPPAKPPDLPR